MILLALALGLVLAVTPGQEPRPTVQWTYPSGYKWGRVAVSADGTVYSAKAEPNHGILHALNPDGSLKWSYALGAEPEAGPILGQDGTVYMLDRQGILHALKPNGTQEWSTQALEPLSNADLSISDQHVYLASLSAIVKVNRLGEVVWAFVPEDNLAIPCPPLVLPGDAVCCGLMSLPGQPQDVLCLDSYGQELWRKDLVQGNSGRLQLTHDGLIVIGAEQGLIALDQQGEIVWSALAGQSISPVMVFPACEVIFCCGRNKDQAALLNAVDGQGQTVWETDFSQGDKELFCARWPGALGPDGTLYLGGSAFHINEPKVLIQTILGTGSSEDGSFGVLTAVDSATGTVKWVFTANDSLEGMPAVGLDGTVYVASWDGHLYALKPPA